MFTMEILRIDGKTKPAQRCDPKSLRGCSEKESAWITKQMGKSGGDRDKELARLRRMAATEGGTAEHLAAWVDRRVILLRKMTGEL